MTEWERLPDESMKWFCRFEVFRLAGPNRSLLGVYNTEQDRNSQKKTYNVPGSWRDAAIKYHWHQRAEAYDVAEQQRKTAEREAYLRGLPTEFDEKYRYIHEQALAAWLRSLEDAVTETSEMVEVPEMTKDAKGNPVVTTSQRMKAQTRKEGQSGNPALLAQAQAALKAIREMFGVDAASRSDSTTFELTEAMLREATPEQIEQLRAGVKPWLIFAGPGVGVDK
jgi:hypothetical protein